MKVIQGRGQYLKKISNSEASESTNSGRFSVLNSTAAAVRIYENPPPYHSPHRLKSKDILKPSRTNKAGGNLET
jgi:hypothetical protein